MSRLVMSGRALKVPRVFPRSHSAESHSLKSEVADILTVDTEPPAVAEPHAHPGSSGRWSEAGTGNRSVRQPLDIEYRRYIFPNTL